MKPAKKISVLAVALILLMSLTACFGTGGVKEKTFSTADFSVTLTTNFKERYDMAFNLYLETNDVFFSGLKESRSGTITSLGAYTSAVTSESSVAPLNVRDGIGNDGTPFKYFFYEKRLNEKDYSYMAVTKAGMNNNYYYRFNFACETKNISVYQDKFMAYAKTIIVQ